MDEASVPTADLAKYWALLRTKPGRHPGRFWPDVAPNHVRNFLDLARRVFYDGLTFHRVMPGF
jgi:cyclophilin family peptidyl-prolyl cis-trans isomerase